MPHSVALVTALILAASAILWQVTLFVRKRSAGTIIQRIPGPPAHSFWTGHMGELNRRDAMKFHEHIATRYGSAVKLDGFAGRPLLYVRDPKALHYILIKEEPIYQESQEFIAINTVCFGPGLLSTLGHAHSKQRKIMNPVFSVNHMRHMAPLFFDIGHKLRSAISQRLVDGPRDIDVMDWMGRVALELVGQGGLGYSFDPLLRDTKDEYGDAIKNFTPLLGSLGIFRKLVPPALHLLPQSLLRMIVSVFPEQTRVEQLKKVVGTMDKRAGDIYMDKKRAFAMGDTEVVQQVQGGRDILSVLMRANLALNEKDRLTEGEVVAQMSTLIFAAMDTTSNTLSRIFHLLSQYQDVQSKLRQELLDARAADGIDYDSLNRLPVLDSVCRETLRRYPPVNLLPREAVADTVLPLGEPIEMRDGSKINEIPVPKGTELVMGFLGCNVNKDMWGDDALEWKPDRWIKGLPEAVTAAHIPGVYSNIMSFSGGKRACIGFKFSEMEMKIVLSVLVSMIVFAPSEKPVCWNMGVPVMFPTVGPDAANPRMYLKLSLYKPDVEA